MKPDKFELQRGMLKDLRGYAHKKMQDELKPEQLAEAEVQANGSPSDEQMEDPVAEVVEQEASFGDEPKESGDDAFPAEEPPKDDALAQLEAMSDEEKLELLRKLLNEGELEGGDLA